MKEKERKDDGKHYALLKTWKRKVKKGAVKIKTQRQTRTTWLKPPIKRKKKKCGNGNRVAKTTRALYSACMITHIHYMNTLHSYTQNRHTSVDRFWDIRGWSVIWCRLKNKIGHQLPPQLDHSSSFPFPLLAVFLPVLLQLYFHFHTHPGIGYLVSSWARWALNSPRGSALILGNKTKTLASYL